MRRIFAIAVIAGVLSATAIAQKPKPKPASKPAPAVFAVLNDGKTIEPIAKVERGMLFPLSDGGDEEAKIVRYIGDYLKIGTKYRLVFGGSDAGTVSVVKTQKDSECMRNMAEVSVVSARAKLKGKVMGLATSLAIKGSGVRRLPSASERAEAEALVRAELSKNGVGQTALKNLKYQNLTALDLNSDGTVELVGSFWVETGAKERSLLFFIAEKGEDGKYAAGISEFDRVKEEDVMSGDIKNVDDGVYHELLLDVLDVNSDGVSEVFTWVESFEGAGFKVYSKKAGKWERIFDGSNYHCGY